MVKFKVYDFQIMFSWPYFSCCWFSPLLLCVCGWVGWCVGVGWVWVCACGMLICFVSALPLGSCEMGRHINYLLLSSAFSVLCVCVCVCVSVRENCYINLWLSTGWISWGVYQRSLIAGFTVPCQDRWNEVQQWEEARQERHCQSTWFSLLLLNGHLLLRTALVL